jgi:hypothetical protein
MDPDVSAVEDPFGVHVVRHLFACDRARHNPFADYAVHEHLVFRHPGVLSARGSRVNEKRSQGHNQSEG